MESITPPMVDITLLGQTAGSRPNVLQGEIRKEKLH